MFVITIFAVERGRVRLILGLPCHLFASRMCHWSYHFICIVRQKNKIHVKEHRGLNIVDRYFCKSSATFVLALGKLM